MNTTRTPAEEPLPEVSDQTLERIESAIFADIAGARQRRGARRGRLWAGIGAAAAVVVIAAFVGPSLAGGIQPTRDEAGDPRVGVVQHGDMLAPDLGGGTRDLGAPEADAPSSVVGSAAEGATAGQAPDVFAGRELVTTGSLSLRVDDIGAAATAVADAAAARGGYVESMNIGSTGILPDVAPTSMPAEPERAWVHVRVPSDQLSAAMDELGALGEVSASQVARQDVTDQTVDLRARIASAEASVARLSELMSQSASVADLISAESALAERQANLESFEQQLQLLEEQVAMSGLAVDLTLARERVEADPSGFGDGVVTGWNALIAALNGIVLGVGFLLPWIIAVAAAGTIIWGITRLVRRGRSRRRESIRSRTVLDPPPPE